MDKSTGNHYN